MARPKRYIDSRRLAFFEYKAKRTIIEICKKDCLDEQDIQAIREQTDVIDAVNCFQKSYCENQKDHQAQPAEP